MSQTRDLISVLKGINFLLRDVLAAGTINTKTIDLRAAVANSDITEVITRIMFLLMVEFGAAGTIDITVQHSDNDTWGWVNLGTLIQADAADGEDFYIAEAYNLKRYVRLEIVVTGVVQSIAIGAVGGHGLREPVVQIGTELAFALA